MLVTDVAVMSFEDYQKARREVIVTDAGNCPGLALLRMLQGKWKYLILYAPDMKQPRRAGDFRQLMPETTNTMLSGSLHELAEDGLIVRRQYEGIPPRAEYSFSEKGLDLLPVFFEMTRWGLKHLP